MTSAQLYGSAAPFLLAGLGWAPVWWNVRVIDRHRRGDRLVPSPATE